jgi:hypothetical protein
MSGLPSESDQGGADLSRVRHGLNARPLFVWTPCATLFPSMDRHDQHHVVPLDRISELLHAHPRDLFLRLPQAAGTLPSTRTTKHLHCIIRMPTCIRQTLASFSSSVRPPHITANVAAHITCICLVSRVRLVLATAATCITLSILSDCPMSVTISASSIIVPFSVRCMPSSPLRGDFETECV